MRMTALFEHDATHYARQIREGVVTPTQLVQRALANIEALNGELNAVVSVQEAQALQQAAEYDQQIVSGAMLPPFFGVPILLKDLGQEERGMPSVAGSRLFAEYVAKRSDYVVEAIQAAGFIIVGRTNVPEFGLKMTSDSKYTGTVNFPYDYQRNAGGSSGGAAAAVAAGIVPVAAASDGGGSIRIPAGFAGLIGLKPSRGRIPVGPNSYRSWQGAAVHFFITKSVRDTWALLKVMQVEQLEAPFHLPLIETHALAPVKRSLRIGYFTNVPGVVDSPSAIVAEVQRVVQRLQALGHTVEPIELGLDWQALCWDYCMMNAVETASVLEMVASGRGEPLKSEEVETLTWAMYQAGQPWRAIDYTRLLARFDQLAVHMATVFDFYDVILTPNANGPAPLHGEVDRGEELREAVLAMHQLSPTEQVDLLMQLYAKGWRYCPYHFIANLAGQPAITLPLAQVQGFPLGMHFWADKGEDRLLLELAAQLEKGGNFLKVNQ